MPWFLGLKFQKLLGNHIETGKKLQRDCKEIVNEPQRNRKETAKKPQRNRKETAKNLQRYSKDTSKKFHAKLRIPAVKNEIFIIFVLKF